MTDTTNEYELPASAATISMPLVVHRVMTIQEGVTLPPTCPSSDCGASLVDENQGLVVESIQEDIRGGHLGYANLAVSSIELEPEPRPVGDGHRFVTAISCASCGLVLVKSKVVTVPDPMTPERTYEPKAPVMLGTVDPVYEEDDDA